MSEEILEPQDMNEPICEGGPTRGMVEEWKKKHGEVYQVAVGDEIFVFRVLTRNEYKDIVRIPKADNFFKEEKIVTTCLLWPLNYQHSSMIFCKAGIPTILADHIMEKSGFTITAEPEKL